MTSRSISLVPSGNSRITLDEFRAEILRYANHETGRELYDFHRMITESGITHDPEFPQTIVTALPVIEDRTEAAMVASFGLHAYNAIVAAKTSGGEDVLKASWECLKRADPERFALRQYVARQCVAFAAAAPAGSDMRKEALDLFWDREFPAITTHRNEPSETVEIIVEIARGKTFTEEERTHALDEAWKLPLKPDFMHDLQSNNMMLSRLYSASIARNVLPPDHTEAKSRTEKLLAGLETLLPEGHRLSDFSPTVEYASAMIDDARSNELRDILCAWQIEQILKMKEHFPPEYGPPRRVPLAFVKIARLTEMPAKHRINCIAEAWSRTDDANSDVTVKAAHMVYCLLPKDDPRRMEAVTKFRELSARAVHPVELLEMAKTMREHIPAGTTHPDEVWLLDLAQQAEAELPPPIPSSVGQSDFARAVKNLQQHRPAMAREVAAPADGLRSEP